MVMREKQKILLLFEKKGVLKGFFEVFFGKTENLPGGYNGLARILLGITEIIRNFKENKEILDVSLFFKILYFFNLREIL